MLTDAQHNQLKPFCSVLSTVRQEDNEEEWLKARNNGVGGSEVGAICGVNNWSSGRQVYFRKIGQFQDETEPNAAAKDRMHFGHVLEPVVAQEFELRNPGLHCVEADCTFKSNQFPFLLANVDRFVCDDSGDIVGILECKTANEMMNDEWNAGEVPISYYYQVQHYMFITGIHRGWIACLVGGNKFYVYDIFFDEQLYTSVILPALDHFWNNCVLKLKEPELQAADDDFFSEIFTADKVDEEPVELDMSIDSVLASIVDLKKQAKDLDKEIKAKQAIIKDKLGTHIKGNSPSFLVTWAPRTRTGIDSSKLRAEYPEVYEDCLSTTSYRQMGIKKVVEDD